MKIFFKITLLATGCLLLSTCGMASKADYANESMPQEYFDDASAGGRIQDKEVYSQQEQEVQQKMEKADTQQQEKKIYFGACRLMVAEPTTTRSEIALLANNSGGYVEAIYDNYIIIRIPKALFTEIFTAIGDMGEVLYKSVETYDVSEYFQDLSTRLEVARKARERLYLLLERTTDVEERLKILKEIKRLSEEIEHINLNLESIKNLIAFSRITIELVARLGNLSDSSKETIPFPWISRLDPFYPSLDKLDGKVSLQLGDDFAVFDQEKTYHAESPEGITVRIGTTGNHPRGDSSFWQQALAYHLQRFYKTAKTGEAGDIKTVLFTSKDRAPFYYLTGIIAAEKKLHVIEVIFPDETSYLAKNTEICTALQALEVNK